ncbi:TlpA disulfide reductase family protein [Pedobacter gandavensis]|uniref:TlpA family protein disulfide reductase n=1 Tax=Pedobacter gandavensis TaxID=2679963 RepID=UPI0024787392|nr:TlpA disulfide reductase family protein [Pedobacter gandavensis]WGQ10435.1 TlpA disulfide reductase family protein [Pedobacter gandavensis]
MNHFSIQKAKLILLATFLMLISQLHLKAQSKSSKRFVVIDLIVQDSSMLNNFYIQFEMHKNNVNTNLTLDKDFYKFKINKKNTRIKVPLSTNVNYGRIKCFYDGQIRLQPFDETGSSIYIFEKGDDIQLIITKRTIRFEGRKTEKYNCMQSINSDSNYDRTDYHKFAAQKKYKEMFEFLKSREDSVFKVKKNLIYQYKSKLNPEIYNLMLADCLAYYYSELLVILKMASNSDEEKKKIIIQTYDKWLKDIKTDGLNENVIVKSFRYCDFLFDKAVFETSFINRKDNGIQKVPYTFKALYDSIQNNHNGIIRDKVTLLTFYINLVFKDGGAYLEPAYKAMGTNIFKTSMSQLLKNYSATIYKFKLYDQYGKLRSLSEFKGKLLVLDFWFTGCLGCSVLAKELKPIIQSYIGNKDIEFISISIDTHKEVWLKSVNEETYSDKDQINLFTSGLGEQHLIIRDFSVQSYPALFLISKNGHIITATMPRPVKGKPETVLAFKKLINKNL